MIGLLSCKILVLLPFKFINLTYIEKPINNRVKSNYRESGTSLLRKLAGTKSTVRSIYMNDLSVSKFNDCFIVLILISFRFGMNFIYIPLL